MAAAAREAAGAEGRPKPDTAPATLARGTTLASSCGPVTPWVPPPCTHTLTYVYWGGGGGRRKGAQGLYQDIMGPAGHQVVQCLMLVSGNNQQVFQNSTWT